MKNREHLKLLNEEYRNAKIAELHSLDSSIEKIIFWYKDLKFNWLDIQDSDGFDGVRLEPFKFSIPEEERETVNKWIIDNYMKLSIHPDKEQRFLLLDSLKAEFEKKLKSAENERQAIQIELQTIDSSFRKNTSMEGILKALNGTYYNNVYFVNPEVYFNYLNYGLEPKYSEINSSTYSVLRAYNAVILALYRQYVEQKLETKPNQKTGESTELTLNQITLLFDYCGIWDALKCDISEKARLFEPFIPSDSNKRIYDSIREAGAKKRKTKEDLEAILKYAEKRKLKTFQEKIKSDLQKVSK